MSSDDINTYNVTPHLNLVGSLTQRKLKSLGEENNLGPTFLPTDRFVFFLSAFFFSKRPLFLSKTFFVTLKMNIQFVFKPCPAWFSYHFLRPAISHQLTSVLGLNNALLSMQQLKHFPLSSTSLSSFLFSLFPSLHFDLPSYIARLVTTSFNNISLNLSLYL